MITLVILYARPHQGDLHSLRVHSGTPSAEAAAQSKTTESTLFSVEELLTAEHQTKNQASRAYLDPVHGMKLALDDVSKEVVAAVFQCKGRRGSYE